jgi:hypothetical protein
VDFRRAAEGLSTSAQGLARYIATVETSKHRFFIFLDASICPDNRLVNFASDDACVLGVLSSRPHVVWALEAGGTLEDRPVYNKTMCFDPFPFPACDKTTKALVRKLGERLDAHRKRQQSLYPDLTMTGMYNALEKLRSGQPLDAKDKAIHEQGLVSVLREMHDELDAAVFDAYGWPHDLSDEQILERLVALNAERAAEEKRGLIRWLRPEYQAPEGAPAPTQIDIELGEVRPTSEPGRKAAWPKTLPEQAQAVRRVLAAETGPATPKAIAKRFHRAQADKIEELLETLAALGHVREVSPGRYTS